MDWDFKGIGDSDDSYGTPKEFRPSILVGAVVSNIPEITQQPWWNSQELPPVQGLDVDNTWARQALLILALKTGKACYTLERSGKPSVNYKELIDLVVEKLGGQLVHVELNNRKNEELFFVWENASISCWYREGMSSLTFNIASLDKALLEEMEAFIATITSKAQPEGRAYAMVQTQQGIQINSVGIAGLPFEPDNYGQEPAEGFSYVADNINSDQPLGRLVILDGSPGNGKTFWVRSLLDEIENAKFIIVPSTMISDLAGPSLLGTLIGQKDDKEPLVLVVEDADECLIARDGGNIGALTTLLNLTDGILGHTLNLYVICTSNVAHYQIDEALKRPGRLLRRIHFEALTAEHAGRVYKRLTGNDKVFTERTSVAKVYQMAKDSGWKPMDSGKTKKLGFGT